MINLLSETFLIFTKFTSLAKHAYLLFVYLPLTYMRLVSGFQCWCFIDFLDELEIGMYNVVYICPAMSF